MAKKHNVNVNETSSVKNPMSMSSYNDNVSRSKEVDGIVDRLQEKLKTKPESRPFLCKVAWKLSEARIWLNYEKAQAGKNKVGLFIYLCKQDGV